MEKIQVRFASSLICLFALVFCVLGGCSSPQDPHIVRVREGIATGNSLAKKGDFQGAAEAYQRAYILDPNNPPLLRNMGIVAVKMKQYSKALRYLITVKKYYNRDPEVYYFLGEANQGLNFQTDAIQAYLVSINLADGTYDAPARKSLAWLFFHRGELSRAQRILKPLLQTGFTDLQAVIIQGKIYNKRGQFEKSVHLLAQFQKEIASPQIKKSAPDKDTARALAKTLGEAYIGWGDCRHGLPLLQKSLGKGNSEKEMEIYRANCEIHNHKNRTAIWRLQRFLAKEPENPEALYLLAKVYLDTNSRMATQVLRKFVHIKSHDGFYSQEVGKAKESLAKLGGWRS